MASDREEAMWDTEVDPPRRPREKFPTQLPVTEGTQTQGPDTSRDRYRIVCFPTVDVLARS